ncbi:MAG: hypothetical protein QM606_06675, partial [Leucobacter sp.]
MPEIAAHAPRPDAPVVDDAPGRRRPEALRWESHVIYLLAIGLAYYVLLDPDVAAWQWVMQT